MKRIIKNTVLIVLCVLTLTVPMLLVACNNDSDYYYSIEDFYGEYTIPLDKYYDVAFWKSNESSDKSSKYDVIGVKKNSFVYAQSKNHYGGYEYKETTFDQKLLEELDRLIELMGDHAEFRSDGVYFNDSRQTVKIPTKEFVPNGYMGYHGGSDKVYCLVYATEENIHSVKYKKSIKVLEIKLTSENIKDENGIEWTIDISRRYKKY